MLLIHIDSSHHQDENEKMHTVIIDLYIIEHIHLAL